MPEASAPAPSFPSPTGRPLRTGGRGRPRGGRWLLFAAGLLVTAVAAAVMCRHLHAGQEEARAEPVKLEGWTVEIAEASGQLATFNGTYRPGQTLCLPAGAKFTVRSLPASLAGTWDDGKVLDGWKRKGGKCVAVARPGGEAPDCSSVDRTRQGVPGAAAGFSFAAPAAPGTYRLCWAGADAAPPSGELVVVVGRKAEREDKDWRIALKLQGKTFVTYHEAAKSGIKYVAENAACYHPPQFFVTLDRDNLDLPLGGGHTFGQLIGFMDRRGPDGKKIYTNERHTETFAPHRGLMNLLPKLKERLEKKGVHFKKFWVTSGFRTSEYNRSIGGAAFSRHCYGDAVDLVIDDDGDKKMDDLNHDGKVDRHDGLLIATAALELMRAGEVPQGGIGIYEWHGEDSVLSHVHIDLRGYPARWGQIGSGPGKRLFDWWTPLGDKGGEGAGD